MSRPATPENDAGGQSAGPAYDLSDEETVHSRTATNATSSTATASGSQAPNTKDGKQRDVKGTAAEDAVKKGSSLVGKINNLVTSDLANITGGRDFFLVSKLSISRIGPAVRADEGIQCCPCLSWQPWRCGSCMKS